jgi:uncharacterized membrane protein SpoIIM required for sporulation
MRVATRLAGRQAVWHELDELLDAIERPTLRGRRRGGTSPARQVVRLGELYRAACADLMLADAYDLPRETVAYLHNLVARAHSAVYRSRGFRLTRWVGEVFHDVPRRLRADRMLRLSALVFYGSALVFGLLAAGGSDVIHEVISDAELQQVESMYAKAQEDHFARNDVQMAGFYLFNNASIGLRCYVFGLTLGIGTVMVLLSNGMSIGAAFGAMAVSPHASTFFQFVTAHGPFELTAIVFAGAAGLGLGRGLIVTDGYTRLVSLRRAARETLPTVGASVFLFLLAAFLEGFVSASPLPYEVKATIAVACAGLLVAYLALGGRGSRTDAA